MPGLEYGEKSGAARLTRSIPRERRPVKVTNELWSPTCMLGLSVTIRMGKHVGETTTPESCFYADKQKKVSK